MIKTLKAQNFRKHADLTLNFTPGINAIRASNEAGKSSSLEAITYALFGAKGLKETIDDVVTYGMPASKLRVELDFAIVGVNYSIARSKSGAELTAPGVKVTGQTEVTRFVEGLLGTTQEMATRLMLAKQRDLGGALTDGPTAAGKMIEDLADLSLIEELVTLIGEKLPAGNTAVQEAQLSTFREQAEPVEQIDLAPLQERNTAATSAAELAVAAHKSKQAELDSLDLAQAREILVQERVLTSALESHQKATAAAQATIDKPELPAAAEGAIEALQAQIAAQKDLATAAKLHAELKSADTSEMWDKDLASLEAEVDATAAKLEAEQGRARLHRDTLTKVSSALQAVESRYQLKRSGLEGRLIKDTTCALCQKDLKDVPEVARINSPLNQQLIDLEATYNTDLDHLLADCTSERALLDQAVTDNATTAQYLKDLQAVVAANNKLSGLYGRASAYISLDQSVVPAQWTWTGPTDAPQDFAGQLATLQRQQAARQAQDAEKAAAVTLQAQSQARWDADRDKLAALSLVDARETLELEAALKPQVQALLEEAVRCEREVAAASQAFELARQAKQHAADQREAAARSLKEAEATLAEMQANNALIKKLRAARPAITDRLWATVLAAVTTYFSDVRGEKSVITRTDGKFKVNGRPITGLSGSAEDVLGLALRFASTKVFLPNVSFVILDEAAAACDDQRELAMLGLLATSGFSQTILVTHSEHCEAFAQNIITIG